MAKKKSCTACVYFDGEDGRGICRFNPPWCVPGDSESVAGTMWPRVDEYDWCGKHEARSKAGR